MDDLRKEIINLNLSLHAINQDISQCEGPMEELNDLNRKGQVIITNLRKYIDDFKQHVDLQYKNKILGNQEAKQYEEELSGSLRAFQKANTKCLLNINKNNREQLLGNKENTIRHRAMKDKENLVKMSSSITDQLLSISRNLADTTKRSADTLTTLVDSSGTIDGTRHELGNVGQVIGESSKLLSKYGRREQTDKFLVFLAFFFFLACVFYILNKRLFS